MIEDKLRAPNQPYNFLEVNSHDNDPLYIRTGAFAKHPDSEIVIPQKRRLLVSRLGMGLWFMFRVQSGTFVLTTPYESARLFDVYLAPGESMFFKLEHVLGFSDSMFPAVTWKLDLISCFTCQYRYVYVTGPGRIILFGLGDIGEDEVSETPTDYDRGSIIAWRGNIKLGVSTRSSLMSAFLGQEQICLDRFVGCGSVYRQGSSMRRLPRRFDQKGPRRTFIEYLNAFLGIRG